MKTILAVIIGCFVGLTVVHLLAHSLRRPHTTDQDMIKMSMRFRGFDDIDTEQHVTCATSEKYVMYHVTKQTETAWILDDFQRSLQIMKISTAEGSICYVTHLNLTKSTSPDAYGLQLFSDDGAAVGEQTRFQTTFVADEMQLDDVSHLGTQAQNLCADTPVFWIRPVTVITASSATSDTHHRDKRNVKKCMSSCCMLVCCCNQRYLQWQTAQKINCHNVCHGCTPMSKTDVREVC